MRSTRSERGCQGQSGHDGNVLRAQQVVLSLLVHRCRLGGHLISKDGLRQTSSGARASQPAAKDRGCECAQGGHLVGKDGLRWWESEKSIDVCDSSGSSSSGSRSNSSGGSSGGGIRSS